MKLLSKQFFSFDSEIVAENLIWKIIQVGNKKWIILETEAYKQDCDEASHAFWKKTPRNVLMYDTYWFVYVYLVYGMYYCLNFTADKDKAAAVLIRWVKDIETDKIYNGCGKVCIFFEIDKTFNWLDLQNNTKIKVFDGWTKIKNIKRTTRKWISKAKDKLWRFIWDN